MIVEPTHEGVILYMIKTHLDSGFVSFQDVDEVLENVRVKLTKLALAVW